MNRTPDEASATERLEQAEISQEVESILVLESGRVSTMRKAVKKIAELRQGESVEGKTGITILCNRKRVKFYQSLKSVDRTMTYPEQGAWAKAEAGFRLLFSGGKHDLVVAILNGERQFLKSKLLFWLIRSRKKIVFDGRLNFFLLGRKNFSRVFSRQRRAGHRARGVEALLFETDDLDIILETARITQANHVIPRARVNVFCRESTGRLLQSSPLIKKTITYRDHSPWSWLKTGVKTVTARNNVIVGVIKGKKRFFLSKILFLISRNRHRLVFNGALEHGFWNRHTYGKIFFQGLKAKTNNPFVTDESRAVLLLETSGPEAMKKIIKIAAQPKVNPKAQIILYCNESRRDEYLDCPEIREIITYSDTSTRGKLKSALSLIFSYPDVVAAHFKRNKEFRPHKLLFWLIRTRSRLVFNESLDCFYLNRKTAGLLFSGQPGQKISLPGAWISPLFRKTVRGLLFIPRFAFLLGWREFIRLRSLLKRKGG